MKNTSYDINSQKVIATKKDYFNTSHIKIKDINKKTKYTINMPMLTKFKKNFKEIKKDKNLVLNLKKNHYMILRSNEKLNLNCFSNLKILLNYLFSYLPLDQNDFLTLKKIEKSLLIFIVKSKNYFYDKQLHMNIQGKSFNQSLWYKFYKPRR